MATTTDIPFVPPAQAQLTAEAVDSVAVAKLAIYETRGWTRTDKTGRTVPDDVQAKNFVYEYFRDNVVINSDSDVVDGGLSATDLYAKAFPQAPGATSEPVDDVQYEAYKDVMRKLWQWAGTSISSHCQETAEMEGFDYVMVEKRIFRTSRDGSTGTGAPKQVSVRFFTSNAELIFTLSSQPAAAKLIKAAEETAKHLRMNTSRHPELTQRVAKETRSALRRSEAHLAPVTDGKSTGALTAGNGDNN